MNILYQDLNFRHETILKHFRKNPSASISAMFRKLRRSSAYSFFGDYAILALIISTGNDLKIVSSRFKILYALNQSEELSDFPKKVKKELLNQLMEPPYVQLKRVKNAPQQKKTRNLSNGVNVR